MILVGFVIKVIGTKIGTKKFVLCCEHAYKGSFTFAEKTRYLVPFKELPVPPVETFIPITGVSREVRPNILSCKFDPEIFFVELSQILERYEKKLKRVERVLNNGKNLDFSLKDLDAVDELMNLIFYCDAGYVNIFKDLFENEYDKITKIHYTLINKKEKILQTLSRFVR